MKVNNWVVSYYDVFNAIKILLHWNHLDEVTQNAGHSSCPSIPASTAASGLRSSLGVSRAEQT